MELIIKFKNKTELQNVVNFFDLNSIEYKKDFSMYIQAAPNTLTIFDYAFTGQLINKFPSVRIISFNNFKSEFIDENLENEMHHNDIETYKQFLFRKFYDDPIYIVTKIIDLEDKIEELKNFIDSQMTQSSTFLNI